MVGPLFDRRLFLGALASGLVLPSMVRADDFIDLDWSDLLPEGELPVSQLPQELIDHTAAPMTNQQPVTSGVRSDWNGQTVRLPGYIVPIEQRGTGVVAFILVPFVGACVHVPPPPSNQLVFVTTEDPYESSGLFEAVNVTGMFGVSSVSTQLADISYALSADHIEPFA